MTNQKRMEIERQIAARIVADAIKAGYTLRVEETLRNDSANLAEIKAALHQMDEDKIYFYQAGQYRGMVYLVYGNDGYDVICDYSVILGKVLEPAEALATRLEHKYG
jgi:hypothetical protein